MRRLMWLFWWAGALFLILILGCLVIAKACQGNPILYVNMDVKWLHPDKQAERTKIAVFGDTQKGLAGFAALAQIAKREGVDLAIHTGDLVSRADAGHYDLALLWIDRPRLDVPFFVAPGNHDIKGREELFEKRIGPRQFALRWGPVDIVIVDNAVGPPDEAAVERMLASAKGPILLFMHVPPNESPSTAYTEKPAYRNFLALIRKYPVRYVFSGHAHGYSRVEHQGVVFISNGVGGDSDSWQFDQKAYLTIVEADVKSIKDRSIVIDPVFSLRANFEHLAIGHVGEIVLRRVWGIPALLLLMLVLFLLFKRLRRKKEKVAEPEKPKMRFTPAKTSEPPDVVI